MFLDVAFDVDEAALDFRCRPGRGDGFEGAFLSIGGHDQGWLELVEEAGVVVGVFFGAPAPGDDVVEGAGHEEAFGVEESTVDEELVIDAVAVGVAGDLYEPVVVEPAGQGAA